LVRLGQTLQHLQEITWVIVEDAKTVSPRLRCSALEVVNFPQEDHREIRPGAPRPDGRWAGPVLSLYHATPAAMPARRKLVHFNPRKATARGVANRWVHGTAWDALCPPQEPWSGLGAGERQGRQCGVPSGR
jgi:hypothetical protein